MYRCIHVHVNWLYTTCALYWYRIILTPSQIQSWWQAPCRWFRRCLCWYIWHHWSGQGPRPHWVLQGNTLLCHSHWLVNWQQIFAGKWAEHDDVMFVQCTQWKTLVLYFLSSWCISIYPIHVQCMCVHGYMCMYLVSFFVTLPNMVLHVKDVGVRFVFSVVVMKGIP